MKTNAGQASRLGGGLLWRALAAAILALTFALVPQAALADEPTVLTAQSDGNYTSVEFVPVEPLVLTSGKEGYPVKDEVSGETWEYFEWFSFPREGDILRFTADDGTEDYTFTRNADEPGYYNADGSSAGFVWWDGGQSATNQWTPDHPGIITIETAGSLSCTYQVQILPNPVESIAFEPKAPYVLHEGVDGMEEVANYDDGDITWFRYDEPRVKDGDTLTVNLTNGSTKTYHFNGNAGVFVSDDDPNDVIEQECEGNGGYSFWGDQYARNQWSPDNPGTMKMTYYGHSVTFPVKIVPPTPDPTDKPWEWRMSYEPVSPLEVSVEDMVLTRNDFGQPCMVYEFPYQTGDFLAFKHNESGEKVRYRLDYKEDGTGTFTNVDNPEDTFAQSELWIHWSDEDRGFYLDYRSWQILVEPFVDNHVTDIEYKPARSFELREGQCVDVTEYTYDDDGNPIEVTYGVYNVIPDTGDTLIVTYDDNTKRTFTCSWGDSGLVIQDAEGTLPGELFNSDDQSYENQWGVGEHKVTFWYAGQSCDVPVTIVADKPRQVVSVDDLALVYGKTGTLQASTTGDGALSYTSSNTKVATVDANGVVKATGAGTAQITVIAAETDNFRAAGAIATISVSKAPSSISLVNQAMTYNGQVQTYSGKVTKSGSTGKVSYAYYSDAKCTKSVKAANVKNAGTYYVKATLAADANHQAKTSAAAKLTINKAKQHMMVMVKRITLKASALKAKAVTKKAADAFVVNNAQGKVTYARKSGSGKIKIAKTGKVTISKGTGKGAFRIVVTVKAAGNANYESESKVVILKVIVK